MTLCLTSSHVSFFTKSHIHEIFILISAPIPIAPTSGNSDISFIDKPNSADFSPSLFSDLFGKIRQKAFLPVPNGFIRKLKSTNQKEFSNVLIAEFVTNPAQQDLKDDVSRNLNEIEWCVRPFVIDPKWVLYESIGCNVLQCTDSLFPFDLKRFVQGST